MKWPDVSTLSKHKYLYLARLDKDGRIRQERRTVAYINRDYVFFALPGSTELGKMRVDEVLDDLPPAVLCRILMYGERGLFAHYWEPAPKTRLNALALTFRYVALNRKSRILREKLEDAETNANNAQEELTRLKAEQDMFNEQYVLEKTQAKKKFEERAEKINKMITEKPLESTFIHPGFSPYGHSEELIDHNYRTARILHAYFDPDQDSFLSCTIQFPNKDRTFDVPDYSLPGLLDLY